MWQEVHSNNQHHIRQQEASGLRMGVLSAGSFRVLKLQSYLKGQQKCCIHNKILGQKAVPALYGVQDGILLGGKVWVDETFIKVRKGDVEKRPDGKEYRGLSRNQICIGIACDRENAVFVFEGYGKTSKKKTLDAFSSHIKECSHLIHDKEEGHSTLVSKLGLTEEAYDSRKLKGIPDNDNPLDRVNELCNLLQQFLSSHSGFNRDDIQDYLNLFSVMVNPPHNKYEKVKKILELGLEKPVLVRFRD